MSRIFEFLVVAMIALFVGVSLFELNRAMAPLNKECRVKMVVKKDYVVVGFNGIFPMFSDVLVIKTGKDERVLKPWSDPELQFIQSLDDDFSGWIKICSGGKYPHNRFHHLF